MKKIVIAIVVIGALLLAAYAASPLIAVRSFVGAARSGDPDKLEANVDFPAVRESLKSQLGAALMVHMQNDPEMKDNPFAGLGMMMAPAIVDRMIDTIVTPDGIAAMVRQGKLRQDASSAKAPAAAVDYHYGYLSLDRFRVTLNGKDAANPLKLIFERRGLFSWKLVKIDIPDSVFAEKSAADTSAAGSQNTGASDPVDNMTATDDQMPISAPSPVFLMPSLPTPIEQTQCQMDECTWQQITSVSDLKQSGNEVLRMVHSRIGNAADGPNPKIAWRETTSYDLCSIARPTSISWDADANSYLVTPLDVASPFGYQISAVAEYKTVCHGLSSDSQGYLHPEQLGYVDRGDSSPQYHVKSPEQVFGASTSN